MRGVLTRTGHAGGINKDGTWGGINWVLTRTGHSVSKYVSKMCVTVFAFFTYLLTWDTPGAGG